MSISRRSVLAASAAAPFIGGTACAAGAVSIRLDPARRLRALPSDFMGLGYEISSVAVPGLLSAENRAYVQLVRNLGKRGVIRVGGNTSDFSSYDAKGQPLSLPKGTVVNAENFRQLRSFLDAIGWNLIWGLNLGNDKLDNALEEARAIVDIMGERLLALEIGNEPDLFVRAGHRQEPYDYAAWHGEYRRYKTAIRAALPRVPFAGPDLAGATNWMQSFARDEGGDIALLTAHHYIGGQANPTSTLELMLQEEKEYQPALTAFQAASEAAHRPWRMCETASYSGGGKAGASDTFAAALWVLDYLFVLASYGCGGVNMETGVNHLGWISHYTPISDDLAGRFGATPEYYGLLAFAQAARGEHIGVALDTGGINLTAYATQQSIRAMTVAVINKDQTRDATVEVAGPALLKSARAMRLAAPALSAMTGVTLGGASMAADGRWSGGQAECVKTMNGKAVIDVLVGAAAFVALTA